MLWVEILGDDLSELPFTLMETEPPPTKEPRGTTHKMLRGTMGTEDRASPRQQHPHRWACAQGTALVSKESMEKTVREHLLFLPLALEKCYDNAASIIIRMVKIVFKELFWNKSLTLRI